MNKSTAQLNFRQATQIMDVVFLKDRTYVKELIDSNKNWFFLNKELVETNDELNKKIKELEEANQTANSEVMMMKLETDQWRKAAKAIASAFVEGADICSETPELESLVLYYTNRAAKRMSIGKIRKALDDSKKATRLHPSFLKAHLTAANCHLVLGEIDDALHNYKNCLDSGMVCLDRKLTLDASAGLQNAEKVTSYINKLTELLHHKTFELTTTAMEVVKEALSISPYSEKLLEMKGEALLMLQKYEEVVQMCKDTLTFAEKNCATTEYSEHISDEDQIRPLKIWRWSLLSRSYFHMAMFPEALATLQEYEQLAPLDTKTHGPSLLSSVTIYELLRCKSAGKEAYDGGKYREAAEHYTNAIMQNIESKSFTAICLSNRAAALQDLGEVTDAIADCNLAIALDGNYIEAISKRAKLHEKIRDYEHAAVDFQRLVTLLEKKGDRKYVKDLTEARGDLSSMNNKMKKGIALNLYLILGLKGFESSAEIKKAYHKAALRHHPDKAGKLLVRRRESGVDGHFWEEIFTTIHKDADRVFKIIGEAYDVLSDTQKRSNYDLQETMHDDVGRSSNE